MSTENIENGCPVNGLIDILNERAEEQIAELPHSADGKDCQAFTRFEFVNPDGEITNAEAENATLFYEIVFSFGNEEEEQSFSLAIPTCRGEYDGEKLDSELDNTSTSLSRFYEELQGKSHEEYFSTLAKERYLINLGEAEEKPPFDYKSFFIGASVISAALILMLLLINEILPRLL